MEERVLVDRLRAGDQNAYRLVVDSFQSTVLNCCFRFVNDRETAEDLTQDVFIEVFRSVSQFRSESKLSTWIYRIAIAKSLDHLKAKKRRKRLAYFRSRFAGEEGTAMELHSDAPDPLQLLEQEERKRVLADAIASLPDNQRVAFTLSKYEELSYQEIADVLETTIPAVESLLFRAKTNLRKRLFKHYEYLLRV